MKKIKCPIASSETVRVGDFYIGSSTTGKVTLVDKNWFFYESEIDKIERLVPYKNGTSGSFGIFTRCTEDGLTVVAAREDTVKYIESPHSEE